MVFISELFAQRIIIKISESTEVNVRTVHSHTLPFSHCFETLNFEKKDMREFE